MLYSDQLYYKLPEPAPKIKIQINTLHKPSKKGDAANLQHPLAYFSILINDLTDAKAYAEWMKSFNDKQIYLVAHGSFGFGPNAMLNGDIVEDERVWG